MNIEWLERRMVRWVTLLVRLDNLRYVANLKVHRAEAMGALESQVSKPRWFGEPMWLEVVWGDFIYYGGI